MNDEQKMHSGLNLREDWKKKLVHFTIKMYPQPFYYDKYPERRFQFGLVYTAGLSFRPSRLFDWVFSGYFINCYTCKKDGQYNVDKPLNDRTARLQE